MSSQNRKLTIHDIICVGLSIPISLVIYVCGRLYSNATNDGKLNEFSMPEEESSLEFLRRFHSHAMAVFSVDTFPLHHVYLRIQEEIDQRVRCDQRNFDRNNTDHCVASLPRRVGCLLLQQFQGHEISTRDQKENRERLQRRRTEKLGASFVQRRSGRVSSAVSLD